MEVVALAAAGRLNLHVETFPLDQALEVYRKLRAGEVAGRAVLLPHGCERRSRRRVGGAVPARHRPLSTGGEPGCGSGGVAWCGTTPAGGDGGA